MFSSINQLPPVQKYPSAAFTKIHNFVDLPIYVLKLSVYLV